MAKQATVKKILAWTLALALVSGNAPLTALAEELPSAQDAAEGGISAVSPREGEPAVWFESDQDYSDTYEDGGGNLTIFAGKAYDDGEYPGGSVTLTLNTGDLEYETINWEIGRWEPDEGEEDSYHIAEDESLRSCIDEAGKSVTVDGENWTGMDEDDSIVINAEVMDAEGNWLASSHVDIQIRQWYYDFQWPEGDRTMLPYWGFSLSNTFNCYMENPTYPDGFDQEVPITGLEISQDDEVLSVQEWDDGNGWDIRAENFGEAKVTLQYDPDLSGESGTYTFTVTVAEDVYDIYIESETGTDQMLPGAQMTLDTSLSWTSFYDWDEGEFSQDTDGFSVNWEIGEGSDAALLGAESGSSVTVTAQEGINDRLVQVIGTMCDADGAEYARGEYWIYIAEQYYVLETSTAIGGNEVNTDPDDSSQAPEVGDEITVTPKLTFFDAEHPNGTDMTGDDTIRYVWNWWDEGQLLICDQYGNELTWGNEEEGIEEKREGTGFFTVTKRTNDWTDAWLEAQVSDGEGGYSYVTSCNLVFGGHDYSIWLDEGVREDHYTWVFSDEDLTIRTVMDTDSEKLTFAWEVGLEENGEISELFTEGTDYDVTEDGALVLHGAALQEKGLEQSFWIRAVALVDDVEVWSDSLWADVRESEHYYNWNHPYGVLRDDSIYVWKHNTTSCYLSNANHPYGEDVTAEITNIQIAGQYSGYDEDGSPIEATDTVATLSYSSSEEMWEITGKNNGYVFLDVTYRLPEEEGTEDEEYTESIRIYVEDELFSLEWDYPEGTDNMLRSSALEISDIILKHDYIAEDGEHIYGEEIPYDDLDLEFSEHDENLVTAAIGEDGTSVVITSTSEEGSYGSTDVLFVARRDYDGQLLGVASDEIHVNVTDQYYALSLSDLCVQPGDVISADDMGARVTHYSEEHPEGTEVDEALDCYFYGFDGEIFTENEMGDVNIWGGYTAPKTVTVSEDVLNGADQLPLTTTIGVDAFSVAERDNGEVEWFENNFATVTICSHEYESAVTKESTCEEAGERTYTCKYCGSSYTEEIPATDHEYDAGKVTKAATCTEAGVRTYTCVHCGKTYTEAIPAAGHQWSSWTTVAEATVFTAETQQRSCAVCHTAETRTVGSKLSGTISLNASSLVLQVKQKTTALKVSGMAAGDYVASVTSGNTKLLKVTRFSKEGTVTLKAAKKTGSTKLTIKLASGTEKTIRVKIQKNMVKTTKISGLTKKLTVSGKKKLTLAAALTPITSQQKLTYASSNKKVAAVSAKGVLTTKKKGKAKITVKSGSKKFVIRLTVK